MLNASVVCPSDNYRVFAWRAPLCVTLHKDNYYFQYLAFSEGFYNNCFTVGKSKNNINGCLEKS